MEDFRGSQFRRDHVTLSAYSTSPIALLSTLFGTAQPPPHLSFPFLLHVNPSSRFPEIT